MYGVNGGIRVPTAIAVTSADLVLPAPDRHTPGAAVLRPPGQLDLEGALAETTALLEAHGHLVVVVPSWLPAATVRRLHTVRAILETDRMALVEADLPPLGTALLVRQLRQLSVCEFSPGVLASAARLLSHYIYAGALLGSVAKLDRVPVGLKAHARSWSPGAQFAVLAHPTPHLARLAPSASSGAHAGGAAVLPPGPGFVTHLTFARGQLASDWVAAELAPAWQVSRRHGEPAARRLGRLVGDPEARRVRRRHPGPVRALPARRLGPPRGVPLVRHGTHRRPLRLLLGPADRAATGAAARRMGRAQHRPDPDSDRPERTKNGEVVRLMNSRQRRGVILLLLSVLCALAAFAGVLVVIGDVNSKVGSEVVAYRVKGDIAPYSPLGAGQFEEVKVPKRWLSETAVTDLGALKGKIALTTLKKGSLLQEDMFVDKPQLQPGEQEIAIMIDAATGVAGKITSGAKVNIIATFKGAKDTDPSRSVIIVANARVLNVGKLTPWTRTATRRAPPRRSRSPSP